MMLNPILEEIAVEYEGRVKFVRFNILASPDNRQMALRYGIMSTPTLMFFCAGKPIGGLVGFLSKEKLKALLDHMLEVHRICVRQSSSWEIGIV